MRIAKKVMAVLCALAIVVTTLQAATIDAQAATKTHTYKLDSKSGAAYPSAVRVGLDNRYDDFRVYLKSKGDYVASIKSNSKNMIAKVTYKYNLKKDDNYTTTSYFEGAKFKSVNEITCFTRKKGTYTLTLTIKNASKKTIATKKVKVIAGQSEPFKKFTFAGKDISLNYVPSKNLTKKSKGKIYVKANSDFKIRKIEVGGFKADGTIDFKTVRNNSNITLSNVKTFKQIDWQNENSGDWYSYYHESGSLNDFIFPMTTVRVTVYDQKLKIEYTVERYIFKQV